MASNKRSTQDKSEPEAAPEEESAPAQASEPADEPTGPRPWRVEPFSDGASWGWRICAADGVIVHESTLDFDSEAAAIAAAGEDGRTEGATFPSARR